VLFIYWLEDHPRHAVRMNQIQERMKERLRSRLGLVAEEELAALEDGLRQIMQLG
jgi:hypothetical protein